MGFELELLVVHGVDALSSAVASALVLRHFVGCDGGAHGAQKVLGLALGGDELLGLELVAQLGFGFLRSNELGLHVGKALLRGVALGDEGLARAREVDFGLLQLRARALKPLAEVADVGGEPHDFLRVGALGGVFEDGSGGRGRDAGPRGDGRRRRSRSGSGAREREAQICSCRRHLRLRRSLLRCHGRRVGCDDAAQCEARSGGGRFLHVFAIERTNAHVDCLLR